VKILALDTATEQCSAALWLAGEMRHREAELDRGHAQHILPMVDELLAEGGVGLTDLDAVAFGRGPGAFTGVRLCASVTQALAFAADLPVVPISDLRAVAQRMRLEQFAASRVVVCNDARMKEVYWGCYEACEAGLMQLLGEERVGKPEEVRLPSAWKGAVHGAGRGFQAYAAAFLSLTQQLTGCDLRILPRAREIALLAGPELLAGRVFSAEEAIPVYLRDDVARAKL